jgi:hypothetical protein
MEVTERNSAENTRARPGSIKEMKNLPADEFVLLDESGVNIDIARRYGRAVGQ